MNWINRGTKVLQGNIDKGVNMKKALAIFVTVCLLASLFVSCDNTTKLDELVSTRFDAAGSRSLIVSNENFIDFNDSSIKWQYKAGKVTDPSYNVGAAADWTDIPGTTPGLLSNTIEFSQGKWNFELRAVKTTDTSVVIYYGKTEAPVLLEKQTSTNPQSIVINLTAQLSGQKGYIVLSGIGIKHNADDTSTFDVPDEVKIGTRVLIKDTDYTVSGNTISTTADGLAFDVGTYTITVKKTGANGEILAMEEKTVEVYAGLKTTISNWILEITQAGKFEPVAPTGTVTEEINESATSVTFTVSNVTPSMVSGKNTIVTVPTNVLGGNTSATVSVAVKQVVEASSSDSFMLSSSNATAAAAIDLTLTASNSTGSSTVSTFTDPVTVNTVVAKGLSGVNVTYNGTTEGISDVSYDDESGALSFKTTHFSTFVVETSSVAVIGDVAFDSLKEAIEKAKSGETVTLINSKLLENNVTINDGRDITLDLNGHDVNGVDKYFMMYAYDGYKGGTLKIVGKGNITCIFLLKGDKDPNANSAHLIIGKDVTVDSQFAIWVDRYPTNNNNSFGVIVDIYGTIKGVQPIYVSGNIHASNDNVPTINIHDGATIDCTDTGIYLAGYAKTIIGKAEIKSNKNAINIAAGELYIDGATITGGSEFSYDKGSGGSISVEESSAVYVKQHSTNLDLKVKVDSGTFKGAIPFYQAKGAKGENAIPEKVSLAIKGGNFTSTYSGTDESELAKAVAVKSDDKKGFITGGTFSSDPSEYIGDFSFAHDNGNGTFTISSLSVDEDGAYLINNANDLVLFEKLVNERGNGFNSKTVKLANNIDLADVKWKPIGTNADGANKFKGIFDGQGHTISNMTVDQGDDVKYRAAGFFGALNGTAKNIIFDNATVTSISKPNVEGNTNNGIAVVAGSIYTSGSIEGVKVRNSRVSGNRYVGGVSGYTYGSVKNCTVENTTVTSTPDNLTGSYDNGDKAGGVVGAFWHEGSYAISGNTVKNVTVKGYRDIGGIVGYANGRVTDNTVNGLTLIQDYSVITTPKTTVEAVIGRHDGFDVDDSNTVTNVPVIKRVEVSNAEGLSNALDAAKDGDVIEITKDISLDSSVIIKKSITINGHDHSISYTGKGHGFLTEGLQSGANVIVKNCVFEKPAPGNWSNTVVGGITYQNCTFNGGCVYVTPSVNDPTITIEGCTFNGAMLTIDFMNTVKRNTDDPIDGTLNAIIRNNTFNINTPFNINNMHDGVGLVMFIREDSGFYTNNNSKVQITVEENTFNNQTSKDSYCAYQIIQTWTGSLTNESTISAISTINQNNTFAKGALYSWANYSPWTGWSNNITD